MHCKPSAHFIWNRREDSGRIKLREYNNNNKKKYWRALFLNLFPQWERCLWVQFISAWLVIAAEAEAEAAALFKNVHSHTHTHMQKKFTRFLQPTNKVNFSRFNAYAPNEISSHVFRCGVRNYSAATAATIVTAATVFKN